MTSTLTGEPSPTVYLVPVSIAYCSVCEVSSLSFTDNQIYTLKQKSLLPRMRVAVPQYNWCSVLFSGTALIHPDTLGPEGGVLIIIVGCPDYYSGVS